MTILSKEQIERKELYKEQEEIYNRNLKESGITARFDKLEKELNGCDYDNATIEHLKSITNKKDFIDACVYHEISPLKCGFDKLSDEHAEYEQRDRDLTTIRTPKGEGNNNG